MNMDPILRSNWTVSDVMSNYPETIPYFLKLKTSCAGCYLARFCTLEDVARVYELLLQDLLGDLDVVVRSSRK
ncbi:MAG: hypothetical protein C3F07_02740 [Anaerolineales bacterium]|nr:DUF1858 domain-containing protein [Anaerolineae bacterium]PWB76990.1 MAG: hypothetical protein C3F07_02740 [Anaerolineales bacterium]